MTPRTIRLLHVEDDRFQQKLIAHHLKQVSEVQFTITCARSEDEAVAEFGHGATDFVLLDYHLSQGDGLSCLRALRRQDPIVPIIAVSGAATPEIAAQLLQSGADDYISKRELSGDGLARGVRLALARTDAWRRRALLAVEQGGPAAQFRASLRHLVKLFLTRLGATFWQRLADCEAAAREAGLPGEQVREAFEAVCTELEGHQAGGAVPRQFLRPLLLEMQARLADSGSPEPAAVYSPGQEAPQH
jgi:CheY-like chemotaxis protein